MSTREPSVAVQHARDLLAKPTVVAQVWEARTSVANLMREAEAGRALAIAVEHERNAGWSRELIAALNDFWRIAGIEP